MIVYKNSFDIPSSGSSEFPAIDLSIVNFLVVTWVKLTALDIWNTIGGALVQTGSVNNNFIVCNTGDIDHIVKFDQTVGDELWNSTVVLSTNITATIGVALQMTPTRLSIINRSTGVEIAALENNATDDQMYSTTLNVVGYRHGQSVYFSVYDVARKKTHILTTERARTPITFSTYVALRGRFPYEDASPDAVFDNLQIETFHSRVDVTEGMQTLTTLRARVQEEIQDSSVSTALLDTYLNRAYSEIYFAEHWRERKFTADIVLHEGIEEYGLPVAIGDIGSLRRYNGMLRYDGEKALEQIYCAGADEGTPENVTTNGRTIKFYPSPSSDWEGSLLRCEYYAGLTRIATNGMIEPGGLVNTTDYPNLHPALHECVAQLAANKLLATLREDGNAPVFKRADYDKLYRSAKDQALIKDLSPAQIRIYRR
jgi:hypothetical protein